MNAAVLGTSLALILSTHLLASKQYNQLYAVLLVGYGFAWIGHFFFEVILVL